MGFLSALGSAYANKRYKPHKPSRANLSAYEGMERGQIDRLQGDDPYAGKDLGLNQNQLQGLTSEGRDLTRGERTATKQRISDTYRRSGKYGVKSAQFDRANERADLQSLQDNALIKRKNIIADAMIRRQDYSRRLNAIQNAYQFGTGVFNAAERNKYLARSRAYEGLGQAGDDAISTATMGFAG